MRRFKVALLSGQCYDTLLDLMRGHACLVNLPADSSIRAMHYDVIRHAIVLQIWSQTFDDVPEAEPAPFLDLVVTRERDVTTGYRWWTVRWWDDGACYGVKLGPLTIFAYVLDGLERRGWTWRCGHMHVYLEVPVR